MKTKNISQKNEVLQKIFSQKYIFLILGIILSAITFLTFSQMFQNELTNWDDDIYIEKLPFKKVSTENVVEMFAGKDKFYNGNYHPLTMLSYSVNFQQTGIKPFSYHLTNLLLHVFTTLLVFWFVYLLIKSTEISFIASLFFGINTLHVESVVWLSERKDVLYSFFFVLSLIFYLKYIDTKKFTLYIIAFFLFLLSLFSKGQAVSLSLSLIVIDYFRERKLFSLRIILEKIPFFILSLIFGLIAVVAQGGGLGDIVETKIYQRIIFALYSFSQYLVKLTFPFSLSLINPYPDVTKILPFNYWFLSIISIFIIIITFFAIRKKFSTLVFGILFYFVNIIFLLQLIPVGDSIYSDRYSYIPSIAWCFLIGILYKFLITKFEKLKNLVRIAFFLYAIMFISLTIDRISVWKNSLTLWNDVIAKEPTALTAYDARGSLKNSQNDLLGALKDYEFLIFYNSEFAELYKKREIPTKNYAKLLSRRPLLEKALGNVGVIKGQQGNLKDAIYHFNVAIQQNPESVLGFSNRGMANFQLGNYEEAIKDFNMAISLSYLSIEAYYNRGLIFARQNKFVEAESDFSQVISLSPYFAEAYRSRGLVRMKLNRKKEGCEDLQNAYQLGIRDAMKDILTFCK